MKKIFTFILSLFTLLNSEASWYPQFQYGIMPCMVGITLYDASGSLVFTFNPQFHLIPHRRPAKILIHRHMQFLISQE